MIKNDNQHYSFISRSLHWLIASAMIILIAVGWYMTGLSNENIWYYRALDFHQVLGLCVLLLFFVKITWLFVSPNPGFIASVAQWQRYIARTVHTFFVIAMAVIPLTGYVFATSVGDPIPVYNLFEIPGVLTLSKQASEWVIDIHAYSAYTCAALAVLHILVALKHHFVDRDKTLLRMTTGY